MAGENRTGRVQIIRLGVPGDLGQRRGEGGRGSRPPRPGGCQDRRREGGHGRRRGGCGRHAGREALATDAAPHLLQGAAGEGMPGLPTHRSSPIALSLCRSAVSLPAVKGCGRGSGFEAHSIWRKSFGWHPTSQDTRLKRIGAYRSAGPGGRVGGYRETGLGFPMAEADGTGS